MWVPFSAPNFQTQDGSSYVYSAVVARDLLFDPHSVYSSVYQFRHLAVPNWGATILLNLILCFTGVEYAEKVLMSVTLLIGFFCVSYCIRSLAPQASPWTPLTNFVLQNWLLWTGFYNFYLATMAALVLIGYYIRRTGRMTVPGALVLSAGLVGVFLIHLMGAAIAMLGLTILAFWRWMVQPERREPRQVALVAAAMVPAIVLALIFAITSGKPIQFELSPVNALATFPLDMFNTASGLLGKQTLLWPVVLAAIVFVIARLSRAEWKTVRGAVAMAVIASFVVYLIVPDEGFGGGQSKVRFAWALFLFGAVLVSSTPKFPALRTCLTVYVSIFLAVNLVATTHTLSNYSAAIADYLAALDPFPRGSRIIRANYSTADIPYRYGFSGLRRDPLLRVDTYVAALCRCIDLTDYQAPNYIFPVIVRPGLDLAHQDQLWHDFEAPGHRTEETLRWLHDGALGRIDYAIVIADPYSGGNSGSFPATIANLNEMGMQLTPRSRRSPFVRVYAREGK